MGQQDSADLKELLTSLRQDGSHAAQSEEFRKKYENYKKLFMCEKHEKECKIKELATLKDETKPVSEIKDLRVKYDT